jgi:hypothetical protein
MTAAAPAQPKVRIINPRHRRACDKHEWEDPWPMAVVQQCAICGAWMVPPL